MKFKEWLRRGVSAGWVGIVVLGLFVGSSLEAQTPPPSDPCEMKLRARPVIGNGTLLSDRRTPLRGARWSLDNLGTAGDREDLEAFLTRGLNTLHVYVENAGDDISQEPSPGYLDVEMDQLVRWTDELGLYLVMTVGKGLGGTSLPQEELNRRIAWNIAFWKHYAARYSECPHVVYEIQNEPSSQPLLPEVAKMEAEVYHHMQDVASETPVLFFSYSSFRRGRNVLQDVCQVEYEVCLLRDRPQSVCEPLKPVASPRGDLSPTEECWLFPEVDWTRAAIAFHGYAGAEITKTTIEFVTDEDRVPNFPGYPVIETELSDLTVNDDLEPALMHLYEGTRTSWLAFIRADAGEHKLEDVVESGNLLWAADYGCWPGSSNPPLGYTFSLRSDENQKVVRVNSGSPFPLVADGLGSSTAQRFTVLDAGQGKVALRSPFTGLYARLNSTVGTAVTADSTTPHPWEWIDRADGDVTLLATEPWQYVAPETAVVNAPLGIKEETQGGAQEAAFTPLPACAGLFQQAESGLLRGPFRVATSGGVTYMEVPNNTLEGAQAPGESKKVSFCVQVTTPGTYRIKARIRAPNQGADSFWVRVDGQPATPYLWVPRPLGGWVEDYVADFNNVDPLEFSLSAGEHTVEFLLREDGTQLDWISLEQVSTSQPLQAAMVTTDHLSRSVSLTGVANPIVVLGPPSFNGGQPGAMRITSVGSSNFQYFLDEWEYLDAWHTGETVGYLALPAGRSTLGTLAAEAGSRSVNHQWTTVSFQQPFSQVPVVVPQIASNLDGTTATVRVRNVTASGFEMQLQEEQAEDGVHGFETVHWIAVVPGQTTVDGRTLRVIRTGNEFTHAFRSLSFGTSLTNPTFVGAMQTRNGSDPAALRYRNLQSGSVELKVEEEASFDTEVDHVAEVVAVIAIDG